MKSKRTSWLMLFSIIILVIAVHNTLRSEVNAPGERLTRSLNKNEAEPSYFTASFLRMAE